MNQNNTGIGKQSGKSFQMFHLRKSIRTEQSFSQILWANDISALDACDSLGFVIDSLGGESEGYRLHW